MNRAVRLSVPAALAAVALLALLAALAIGGAAAPLLVDDPGAVVRFGSPIAQLVVNLAAAMTLGPLVLSAFASHPGDAGWGRTIDLAAAAAGVWTVGAVANLFFAYFYFTDSSINDPQFGAQFIVFATQQALGQSWLATGLITAVITVLAIAVRSHTGVALLAVLAVAALVPMAQQGHAASINADHDAAISALGLHIVFAAVWVGGLAALLLQARSKAGAALEDLVRRYSTIALVCYIVVAASGVVSAVIRVGDIASLFTPYGALIIVKSLVLLVIGALGALYRTRLIPRLGTMSGRRAFVTLAVLELGLMGIASGFAAALARSSPPVPQVTAPITSTPAELLTGRPLPPPPTFVLLLTTWRVDLIWAIAIGFAAFGYLAAVARLRRRGDSWPVHRTVLWLVGLAVLFWLTCGGLNVYQEFLFSSHMLMHMALVMVVPVLLVPGAPITLALRAIRRRTDGTRGGREWILLVVHSRPAAIIANPFVTAVLFAGSLVVFYYSPIFSWATTDHIGHEWMTVHFLITGFLFVETLIGVDPVPSRLPYPMRLLLLLATMAFHAFFGLALLSGNGLLLADWYGAMGWGTSAIADQQAGGGIAWSVGEIPTVILAIVVAMSWARSDERESRRKDRAEERTGDADLNAYNDMLARLGRRN